MQAFLEAAYEYTQIQGIAINRGDPAAYDFQIGDLTIDGAWHDLDLSAIAPANAHFIILMVRGTNAAIGKAIKFRRKGNVNSPAIVRMTTVIANVPAWQEREIPLDANRVIQYGIDAGGWAQVDIHVIGWIF